LFPPVRVRAALDETGDRLGQAQLRPTLDLLRRKEPKPSFQGRALAVLDERLSVALDQLGRPLRVARSHGMANRVVDQPMVLAPAGRVGVQRPEPLGSFPRKADPQQVGEQMVVAPPATHLIQRHQEQIGPLDRLQQLLSVASAGDRVAQRAAQPGQYRGVQQEHP
jgi:hypothetical protein